MHVFFSRYIYAVTTYPLYVTTLKQTLVAACRKL